MIESLSRFIGSLKGWRRNAFAFGFGVCATFTLPPFFVFPLLILAFTGLYWLVNSAPTKKRAFLDGWWWGWGYYITGLYWFCIALLTDAEKFAWMIPFALFGLTAVIALYNGAIGWLTASLRVSGLAKIFAFSVIWTLVEFARSHWLSGFPWNLAGYSFAFSDAALQPASAVGIHGLTWWAVWLGVAPAALVYHKRGIVIATYVLFIAIMGWGQWRLIAADTVSEPNVPDVKLRLVQANVAQQHKWDPKLQAEGLKEHVKLTQWAGLKHITHVIWPETAVPYMVRPDTSLVRALGDSLPADTILITGSLRDEGERENWQVYNSVVALDHSGTIVGSYDKFKLVPFGEFVPFRFLLPDWLLTPVGMKDFTAGKGPQTLDWKGLPSIRPLICYEAIFPELSFSEQERPQLLLNLTNDAWFGLSSGPHQHFHMARMRAVEQGIPLVRVANTGISGVVDAYGRVREKLELGTQGILDISLPKTTPKITFYGKYGNKFLWFLGFIGLMVFGIRPNRK